MILVLAFLLAQAAEPPGLRLQDEGVAKGTVDTINCVGTGIACTRAGRKATLTVTGGGSGSPGGSDTQVQYNAAGAFAGTARVTSDGNDLQLAAQTSLPTAAAGKLTPLAYAPFGPAMPTMLVGDLGFTISATPAPIEVSMGSWSCIAPNLTTTVISVTGAATSAINGTAANVVWSVNDARTRTRWMQYTSSASANSSASLGLQGSATYRGNAASRGGFLAHSAFSVQGTPPANQRLFAGLSAITPGAAADPSAMTNLVGFACDGGATTLSVISNDASGTATVAKALSANFPCTTTAMAFEWWLWASTNAGTVNWAIREMVGGFTDSGVISTDLPAATTTLSPYNWINNGGTAAAATIYSAAICVVNNQ